MRSFAGWVDRYVGLSTRQSAERTFVRSTVPQLFGGAGRRGKGSHAVALRAGAPTITIPKTFGVRIATGILNTLEEVFERDGFNERGDG